MRKNPFGQKKFVMRSGGNTGKARLAKRVRQLPHGPWKHVATVLLLQAVRTKTQAASLTCAASVRGASNRGPNNG